MTDTTLLRAPRETGSWFWWPTGLKRGFAPQVDLVVRLAAVLAQHGLYDAARINCRWRVDGRVLPRTWSTVQTMSGAALDAAALTAAFARGRPDGLPDHAEPGDLELECAGSWLDAEGGAHTQPDLLRLNVDAIFLDPSVYLEVYHDVWMTHDFYGEPHEEIYRRNAPRLTAALTEISALLGCEAEPGESTYFGHAVGLRIENAQDDDEVPLDVTDLIPAANRR